MSRLRVAYVAHSVDPAKGGMELVSARLLERLAATVDLEVVAGDGLDTLPEGVRRTHIPIPSRPNAARLVLFDVVATARLRAVRRRNDLVHACGAVAHAPVDLMTLHLSHAAVIDAQGGARPPGRTGLRGLVGAVRRRQAARLERWAMRHGRTRELVAVSRADGLDLAVRYPGVPVTVVENGADLDRFAGVQRPAHGDDEPLRVVVVAGDFERKGVALAVRAVARTQRCRLRVVGAGDRAGMRDLAASVGAADRVELVAPRDDVEQEFARADVVLSCSLHESFGLAVVEGAAGGCAVVCTATGVGPELVEGDEGDDGAGGIVVPRDEATIAAALEGLDADRATCRSMAAVASRRAARYRWDAMTQGTLARYAALAGTLDVKVLHVGLETTAARPGGLNRYLEHLVAAQRADGLDATALVLGTQPEDAGASNGLVVAAPPGHSMARVAWAMDRAARRLEPPDVADLHFAGTAAITATAGVLRGVPTVVHFQGPWADESAHGGAGRLNVAVKRAVERRVYRRADRFVVLSTSFRSLLERRFGIAPWAIDVVAPGVDLERFAPGDRDTARDAVGAPRGRVVLAVRRLVPRMGLEVLLGAWAALSPGHDDVLAIVGDGPSAPQLRRQARALGVEGTVRLCGRVDDAQLVAWYRAADLTVVPSVALEGFGLVVLESLACGTPVVGTDVAGLAEALELAGEARAVPAGDEPALAAAIDGALRAGASPEQRAARRAVAARHGWDEVAARHREVYDRALDASRPVRVVVLDHTAVLSGAELAIARAVGGLGRTADVHTILGEDGPLRARLEAAGSSVEVLALDDAVRTVHRDAAGPLRVGPRRAVRTARYVVRLARRLRRLRPDVVHANSLKAALYGGAAARLAGVPCVWHVRDRLEPPALPAPAARLVRLAARTLPTVVVANSTSTLATVGARHGHVVPSPLDPSITPRVAGSRPDGPTTYVVLGRIAPWKGQHLAIEAFADAFGDGDERLVVAGAPLFGEDEYAASLPPLAASLGVSGRVELRGFVDDVAGLLGESDVLVHASLDPEPFGQVVVEALGARCAVLVADAGGPAEIVTDGVDGLLYAMGSRLALAAGMRRLADDPALRVRLADAGVVTAAAYTPEALAPLLLAAWNEARRPARAARPKRSGA